MSLKLVLLFILASSVNKAYSQFTFSYVSIEDSIVLDSSNYKIFNSTKLDVSTKKEISKYMDSFCQFVDCDSVETNKFEIQDEINQYNINRRVLLKSMLGDRSKNYLIKTGSLTNYVYQIVVLSDTNFGKSYFIIVLDKTKYPMWSNGIEMTNNGGPYYEIWGCLPLR